MKREREKGRDMNYLAIKNCRSGTIARRLITIYNGYELHNGLKLCGNGGCREFSKGPPAALRIIGPLRRYPNERLAIQFLMRGRYFWRWFPFGGSSMNLEMKAFSLTWFCWLWSIPFLLNAFQREACIFRISRITPPFHSSQPFLSSFSPYRSFPPFIPFHPSSLSTTTPLNHHSSCNLFSSIPIQDR